MPATTTYESLFALLAEHGNAQYGGEGVTQLQHALQTAHLAEQVGASLSLIAAALFHDIGHLAHALGEDATRRGIDDHHETRAVALLRPVFAEAVWRPVALHVQAKRWLCAREPGYAAQLSEESLRSLALQGGPMTAAEAEAFAGVPFAREAIALRQWDDSAKEATAVPPKLHHWLARLGP